MEKKTKTCSKCKVEKELSNFYNSKASGLSYHCKSCDKEGRIKRESGEYVPVRRAKEEELGKQVLMPDGRIRIKHFFRNSFINRYHKMVECTHCKTLVLRDVSNLKKQKYVFCEKCIHLKGEYVYKPSTKYDSKGYLVVYKPEHPNAIKKFVTKHKLVMEGELGRYLDTSEVIHHVDCIKLNNEIENLWLTDNTGHIMAHNSLAQCVKPLMDAGLLWFDRKKGIYKVTINEQE